MYKHAGQAEEAHKAATAKPTTQARAGSKKK